MSVKEMHTAGSVIAGDYELLELIGRGGFGVVWKAKNIRLGRDVAIKMLHSEALRLVPDVVKRFNREVRLAKQLEHPNVVRMYDFGRLEDGSLFMVMEYIDGIELKQRLLRNGPLDWRTTFHVIEQVVDALSEAHGVGVIHRDLKPANIMLARKGLRNNVVKLLDFGIAKAFEGETDVDLTGTGAGYGTPHYMAPEQVVGGDLGPYTDLYAIGLVTIECLTGRRAVVGRTPHEIAMKQVTEDPPLPPAVVGTPVEAVLRKVLEKDPEDRYQTAADFFGALSSALAQTDGVSGVSPVVGIEAPLESEPQGAPTTDLGPISGSLEFGPDQDGQTSQMAATTSVATPLQAEPPVGDDISSPYESTDTGDLSRFDDPVMQPSRAPMILGVVAIVLLVGILLIAFSGDDSEGDTEDTASSASEESEAEETGGLGGALGAIDETNPDHVDIEIALDANVIAEVFRDEELLGTTPFTWTVAQADTDATLRFVATNHADAELVVGLNEGKPYVVELVPLTGDAAEVPEAAEPDGQPENSGADPVDDNPLGTEDGLGDDSMEFNDETEEGSGDGTKDETSPEGEAGLSAEDAAKQRRREERRRKRKERERLEAEKKKKDDKRIDVPVL